MASNAGAPAARPLDFPKDFLFGAAAASFQVEGAADADGKGPSIWDRFCEMPGKTFRGHDGRTACDHYRRWPEDVALMKGLGLQAYRFSVSWPRVMPEGAGKINRAGLDFYSRLADGLLEAGIEPWATLYHWDLPWALHLRGGWLNPDISDRFADYAAAVADALGDRVGNWMTVNEPQVFVGLGLGLGNHAPGHKLSLAENLQAAHHALLAHGKAVAVLRARAAKPARVGMAPVGITRYPATESEADIAAARKATWSYADPGTHSPWEVHQATWNMALWMDPVFKGAYPEEAMRTLGRFMPAIGKNDLATISAPLDFIGFNHYHGEPVVADGKGGWSLTAPPTGVPTTTMGWDVTPASIYWAARFLNERYPNLPLYVTENGIAATDIPSPDGLVHDQGRIEFMRGYLASLARARREGIPVSGYFAWSLMDNFEWDRGYSQRFGLVHVDFATQKRTPKDSARFYADLIADRNGARG